MKFPFRLHAEGVSFYFGFVSLLKKGIYLSFWPKCQLQISITQRNTKTTFTNTGLRSFMHFFMRFCRSEIYRFRGHGLNLKTSNCGTCINKNVARSSFFSPLKFKLTSDVKFSFVDTLFCRKNSQKECQRRSCQKINGDPWEFNSRLVGSTI